MNVILNELFPLDIANNSFKYCIHPTAEIIKPLFCQTCHRRKLKCGKCSAPICCICEECGSISCCMYCQTCFNYYKNLLYEQQHTIIIHDISHIINININIIN